ncbi:MAG: FG-GAP-like repeat-containing protein [Anaerolineae bacterium]
MKGQSRRLVLLIGLLLAPLLVAAGVYALARSYHAAPDAPVLAALRATRAAAPYHLTADVRQTLAPRVTAANLARTDGQAALRVEGDIVPGSRRADDTPDVRLSMRADQTTPSLDVRIVDGKAYVGYQERWQAVDNPLESALPDGDYLGYLSAVVNVSRMEPLRTAGGSLERYTFGIDGGRYAEYQRDRMQKLLADRVPAGVTIGRSARLAAMRGMGELWVDGEGRVRRQILDLSMPNEGGLDDSHLHMVVDFSRFGDALPPVAAPVAGPSGALTLPPADAAPLSAPQGDGVSTAAIGDVALLTAALLLAGLAVVLLDSRRRRQVYAAVVGVTILSMVGGPLVNAGLLAGFQARVAEAATLHRAMVEVGALPLPDTAALLGPAADSARLPTAPTAARSAPSQPATDLRDCRVLYTDQGVQAGDDQDGDGLSNGDEWCLGTNYALADTDHDGITDTLEAQGYTDAHGKVWTLNPLLDDTNQDGIPDGAVCSSAADGKSLVCPDTDSDGIPDAWDDDIDNDGVPNRYDISPFGVPDPSHPGGRVTPPFRPSVDLTISGAYTGSVVYVDLQVQPQNPAHLRYALSWLDWPADDKGQIQDLDNSTQDVQLIPMLEFTTTVKPRLAAQYGVGVITLTNAANTAYRLWVPLQTVADGGQMSAFGAHFALTDDEVRPSLALNGGRIVWLARANLDSWANCKDAGGGQNAQNCQIQTAPSVIASYYDDGLRVTGMQISQSRDAQVAVFGAPKVAAVAPAGAADEGRVMLGLVSGLVPTFLGYSQPTLAQLAQNFSAPANAPYVNTFGLDPSLITTTYKTYAHRDEALATTSATTTQQLLSAAYAPCAAATAGVVTPTLAIAYQESSGVLDMGSRLVSIGNGDPNVQSVAPITFNVPLGEASLSTLRRVQLSQYTCAVDAATRKPVWQALTIDRSLKEMARRYPTAAQDSTWLPTQLLVSMLTFGLSRVVSVNGRALPYMGETADFTKFATWNQSGAGTTTLPDYVRAAYGLDGLVADFATRGAVEAYHAWQGQVGSSDFWSYVGPMVGMPLLKLVFYTVRVYRGLPGKVLVDYFALTDTSEFEDVPRLERLGQALRASWRSWTGAAAAETEMAAGLAVKDETGVEIVDETGAASEAKWFDRLTDLVGVGLLIYSIASLWSAYAQQSAVISGIARDDALATARASTLLNIFLWAFDVILGQFAASGVGLLVEAILLIIIYVIIGAATGDWDPLNVIAHITEWFASMILQVDLYVNQPTVGLSPPNMVIDPGQRLSQGALISSTVELTMTAVTTLTASTSVKGVDNSQMDLGCQYCNGRQGTIDDVKSSWAVARIETDPGFNNGQAPAWTANYSLTNGIGVGQGVDHSAVCDSDDTVATKNSKNCANTLSISFKVTQAGRNLLLPFLNQLEANLAYQKCEGFIKYNCSADMNYSHGPNRQDNPDDYPQARSSLYLDILPADLDSLWSWDVKDPISNQGYTGWNTDRDGDGLPDTLEAQYGADPTKWDSDGDGLSDGYEVYVSRTDPAKADTDGDGLSDGYEARLGLDPLNKDTDGDGLLDGEEVCHLDATGGVVGGWDVRLDSGRTVHVCSDPNKADEDADGLTDSQERAAATSPWAPNTAPGLTLTVAPTTSHNGSVYTVVRPGGSLTATLSVVNTTADPLNKPMTLGYDPKVLGALIVQRQTGSPGYNGPSPTAGASRLTWPFPQQPLHTAEALTATLQGTLAASVGQSGRTTLQATVPYTDYVANTARVLSTTREVRVDADRPSSSLSAPMAGQVISATRFIVGGQAADPTSWVVKVETRIQGQSYPGGAAYDTGWQTAAGADTWSYGWSVPGDGPYTIQSRATDYVGYVETTAAGTAVVVDRTPPVAAFAGLRDGAALQNIHNHTVTLTGVASDTVSVSPKVAGVSLVQLSIDNRPWRNVAEFTADNPPTAAWTYDWTLDDALYGSHALAVRAVDALGQVGPLSRVKVFIDLLPPNDVWSNASDQVSATGVFTFEGHADDLGYVPLPSRPQSLATNAGASLDAATVATAWVMPPGPTDSITQTVVWLGDLNGDGRADFAVGLPASHVGGKDRAGQVDIVYGKAGGWPVVPAAFALDAGGGRVLGQTAGGGLGQSIAPAGDVNGDGLSDFLVGDPANNAVYLIFGQAGPLGDLSPTALTQASFRERGKVFTVKQGQVGQWLAAAGDVNGDGFDDLLVGVTGLPGGKGIVYLVLGSNAATGALAKSQTFALDTPIGPPVVAAAFAADTNGARAVGVGDLNGDGYADFVIADPANALGSAPGVYVMLGGPTYGPRASPPRVNPAQAANGSFHAAPGVGQRVAPLGDVNGDGLPDFAYSDGNTPHIAYGRASGWRANMTPDVTFTYTAPAPNGPIVGVGDVNADGKNDIALGTISGRAYLVLGAADLAQNQPVQAQLGNVNQIASAPFASVADVNCDASSDLLIVPRNDGAAPSAATRAARRAQRAELSLGPATAPRALTSLPTSERDADVVQARPAAKAAAAAAVTRYVDDDYCATCANDGRAWGVTAFATLQAALNAAVSGDTVQLNPGVYGPASIPAGKNDLTIQGVDADAVFIDAGGGIGLQVYPPGGAGGQGITVQRLTIRNAATGIQVNGGGAPGSTNLDDPANIRIANVLLYLDRPNSLGMDLRTSNVDARRVTLVANAPGVSLLNNTSPVVNAVYLRDSLLVALPNAAPRPQWWQSSGLQTVFLNTHNGFAGPAGSASDWASAPTGTAATLMTLGQAAFYDTLRGVFRLTPGSAAMGQATEGGDLGYYTYHPPVWVNPTYCEKCANNGHAWNVTAFNDVQSAVNSGAQRVLVEPGLYRERVSLVNGVRIFGSGAALTVVAPPTSTIGSLVSAEGVQDASLALLTLAGDGRQDGVRVDAGAQISVTRAIIRNTATAVAIDGAAGGAMAAVSNNTLVNNVNGVAAANCGSLDVEDTVFAFHTGTALGYQGCAATRLHNFNAFWRNGQDQALPSGDSPGQGNVFADPRFENPSQLDFRPRADSPLVDAGDPSLPTPPGSGARVDIGYVESAQAAVYVSPSYCAQCANDGLEWGVDAFTTIQAGIAHIPPIDGVFTVGVAPGTYSESLTLRSGVRLVGAGADTTVIDAGGAGNVLTLNGVTNVEVAGFTLQNAGGAAGNANVVVSGFSNAITITHNVLQTSGGGGAIFNDASTGMFLFNTVANNSGAGLTLADPGTWAHARFNTFAYNGGVAVTDGGQGQLFNAYNLFYQNSGGDFAGNVQLDPTSIQGKDPQFVDPNPADGATDYSLVIGSPAVDAVAPGDWQPVPLGGGARADLGYAELLATPLSLLFGKVGTSCALGSSGVASVQVGVSYVTDASVSPEQTMPAPSAWRDASLATPGGVGSYWTLPVNMAAGGPVYQGDGLYRLYTRPADAVGNTVTRTTSLFRATFIADGTAPSVNLITPTTGLVTSAPAVVLQATASDTIPLGGTAQNNLARVYFSVDGAAVTATQSLGANPTYRQTVTLSDGPHAVTAVAVDRAGNVGRSATAQISVQTTRNEAALTSPSPGSFVVSATLSLAGPVHFAATDGNGQVEVLVDGVSAGMATLDNPLARSTTWHKGVTLAGEGVHTIILRASRSAGASGATDTPVTLTKDSVAPTLDIRATTQPITRTIILNGTYSDTTSGVAAVDVSVDGGFTYSPATELVNNTWTYVYRAPPGVDLTRFPLRVRAADRAGNRTVQSGFFLVDNLGPSPFVSTASPDPGSHLTAPATASLFWAPLHDGSGEPTVIAVTDQTSNTIPVGGTPFTGRSYIASFPAAGAWYVHLQSRDGSGNTTTRHYGPWFVETNGGPVALTSVSRGPTEVGATRDVPSGASSHWQSSIIVDGLMNVAGGEWRLATERLDVDPRPTRSQSLWASFDAASLYLGWRGARWGINGTGYVYLDTQPGGAATPWAGPEGAAAHAVAGKQLPFAADYVVVLQPQPGLWRWDGAAWQPETVGAVRAGPDGDTEMRLSWSTLGTSAAADIRLLAFDAYQDRILSVFPTNQSVLGPWTSAYHWASVTPGTAPNAGQPTGDHVSLGVRRSRATPPLIGPGATATWILDISNLDRVAVTEVRLDLAASAPLTLEAIQGAPGAPAGGSWTIPLGDLPPGPRLPITVTARLAAGVTGIDAVTLTAQVRTNAPSGDVTLAQSRASLAVDNAPPQVRIDLPTGATMRTGPTTVSGVVRDESGVSFVEVRVGDGPWRAALGDLGGVFQVRNWRVGVEAPAGGSFVIQARAHDIFGQTSAPVSASVTVDNTPPQATLNLPSAVLRATSGVLVGTVTDPFPGAGAIQRVEVQIDDGEWRVAPAPYPLVSTTGAPPSTRAWRLPWRLPQEEGVPHRLRVRATDAAGNVGAPSARQTVTVDNVAPTSTLDYPLGGAAAPEACLRVAQGNILMWGTARDGWGVSRAQVSVDGGQTWTDALIGGAAADLLANTLCHDAASKADAGATLWAAVVPAPPGPLALRARAIDRAGNVGALQPPLRIQHTEAPPARPYTLYFPTIKSGVEPTR